MEAIWLTAMELAKTGEADKIKLLVPDVPAISAHLTPDDGSPTHWSGMDIGFFSDWKQQLNLQKKVLKKSVILTNEMFPAVFASRLLAHDKLLDYCVRPGISHYSKSNH